MAFSSEKEKNRYIKNRMNRRRGSEMSNREDQKIVKDASTVNYDYIVCKDYRTYIEAFFVSNFLKEKSGRGLKILTNCDFNHNLEKNINELRQIVFGENDFNNCIDRLTEFCLALDEKYTTSTYDLSKEPWLIQLNQIMSEFSLDKRELEFLTILFHLEYGRGFNSAIENCRANSFKEYLALLESFFGFSPRYFNGILNEGMALVELGIIEIDWNTMRDFGDAIEISGNLIAAVNSADSNKNAMSFFYEIEKNSKLPINSFQAYQSEVDKVKKILKKSIDNNIKGINILLYGPPGTGKTEFAKSLANDLNAELAIVENSSSSSSRIMTRFARSQEGLSSWLFSIKLCGKMAKKLGNCIMFLDDADSLLLLDDESHHRHRFSSKHRSNLLKLLEENEVPIIWVVNFESGIDIAVKRRFAWNIEFKQPTAKERIQIWDNLISSKGLASQINENDVKRLAFTYEAQPAIIENSLSIGQLLSDGAIKIQDIEDSLIKSLTLINNVSKDFFNGANKSVAKNYSLDLINTNVPLQNLIRSAQEFANTPKDKKRFKSLCMCFMGLSGTGKTEFVKHLGALLHKKVIFKKASDIQHFIISKTEMNLAEAFKEAENEDAILFLDEVDSFLFNRQNATHSWQVSEVNEILTQMESFSGIFIGATNCKNNLDPACIRRFHFKVEFKPILNSMKIATFKSFFPAITLPSEGLRSEFYKNLVSLENLCLGDFNAVAVRTEFLNFDDPYYLLNELRHEVSAKAEVGQ